MGKITVIGLGAGDLDQLPYGIYNTLLSAEHLYLRTEKHPVVEELKQQMGKFQTFDAVYEKHSGFPEVYQEIKEILLLAAEENNVVYAVPGHPLIAEQSVQLLLHEENPSIEVEIAGGQSFLDASFTALKIDPVEGFQLLDAMSFSSGELNLRSHILICQVYDQMVASEVKLTLMEQLPDEYEVVIVTAAGSSGEVLQRVPLYELDRAAGVNNLTSVYVPPVKDESLLYHKFDSFREIVAELRGPDGCPWDKEQTHESLKKYMIEECYEVLEAIDEEDEEHLAEELGDVLLQVVLHAQIGEDNGMFSIEDVIRTVSEKMIRRHPHVFHGTEVESSEEALSNWDEIKKQEKRDKGQTESLLSSVAASLPALSKAYHLQKKAAKAGFDWPEAAPIWSKVEEELNEFREEIEKPDGSPRRAKKEFGDILFSLVNMARYYKIEPEEALLSANQIFSKRFSYIEEQAAVTRRKLEDMTLQEMDELWEKAKTFEQ
ncbi:nucleoside triphosphate pyrophosphohydrolase [Bacillus lacus]|uniref:Nucleoside triphosphate pyrophosphohydrolase n=1 Tax=Metabacillus lacus TaxID=1983721 RepID=A0A7X2J021_9BACI|nr:nucleoside triphosphate pyrophosphohydrolase [Metabacillus lacus]MRX72962.1 nucleoside triphosphate pyrophosphohydrolase [Metabacillus lacus]